MWTFLYFPIKKQVLSILINDNTIEIKMKKRIQVNVPYKMLLEKLDFIIEKRINPEIYFNGEALDTYKEDDLTKINTILRQNERSITIHAPFMDLTPGGVDTRFKKATIERLEQTLEVAAVFRPLMIIVHPGYNKWFYDGDVKLWLENSLTTWKPIVAKAEKIGTPIAIENIFEEEPSGLQQLLTAIKSPYFNFCFDTGHFHLFSKVSMKEWFDVLSNYIRAVHLHDNFKKADDHLPVGDGEIDFDLFFQLIKRYGVDSLFTIEPHKVELLERSLKVCKSYLMNL